MPPVKDPEQAPDTVAAAIASFLEEHAGAVLLEDGKVLFDLRLSKYSLSTEHGRCTLHLWSEERNLVRRVVSTALRQKVLKLSTLRFGQARPQTLELAADRDRRTPSTREGIRSRYLKVLERCLVRAFTDWTPEGFRTAMDLERSFGPAYARGMLVRGTNAWAVIAVNCEETPSTIDGILTLGLLWLDTCREHAGGRRLFQGLKLIVPSGHAALTLSRVAWLNPAAAQWEVWSLDERLEEMTLLDPSDAGNLATRMLHAPSIAAAQERFAEASEKVMDLVPAREHARVEMKVRSSAEVAFCLHGLEFARVRAGYGANSFNREFEISFGAGANETPLTPENEAALREMVAGLFLRRHAAGGKNDPIYRMQPERWLESEVRRDVSCLDLTLDPAHVHTQVPALAGSSHGFDRGMLDLLCVGKDGRLAVVELKAEEDMHLALQGLDYWIRVRWHHRQNPDRQTGLPEFQRHGYFAGVRLAGDDPRLLLVAPSLRVHPANEVVLRYFDPRVEWQLIGLDERWRQQVKVVWRKRGGKG